METSDTAWQDLAVRLSAALNEVTSGRFIVVDFISAETGPVNPYAQAVNDGGAFMCEIVSALHLPAGEWPLNELELQRTGWSPPYGQQFPNWWRTDLDTPARIAEGLLGGLRFGRNCSDPSGFEWHIGISPIPPGDGGQIPEAGATLELGGQVA